MNERHETLIWFYTCFIRALNSHYLVILLVLAFILLPCFIRVGVHWCARAIIAKKGGVRVTYYYRRI